MLGVGAYRSDDGKPYVLPCVRKAEEIVYKKCGNHEYLPITGMPEFNKLAVELALGKDSCILKEGLNMTVQSLSGTGAIRLGAAFLGMFYKGNKEAYISNPTWGNHRNVFLHSGIPWKYYTYYDPKTIGLDFKGMSENLCCIPDESIVVFHAVAHNPTGVDPTPEQWKTFSQICMQKKHFPFFDIAYQGFASGDPERDAKAVRMFIDDGHQVAVAQSFAKNMGLYGERIGAFTFTCRSKEEVAKVLSQMKIVIRAMYSNPPTFGARLITEILGNPELKCLWLQDVKSLADRIMSCRKKLVEALKKEGSKKDWSHITNQIGMFSFTGLKPEEVKNIIKEFAVYMTADGRISVASLGSPNIDYVAKAIHTVTK
ncbi:aspartate aminotransferase, mitochondrial-like [Anthonomus grandis grandis]|uniref:aspartate aminotransferase, mitochondrial-like n=1 Tax=Anthonomus grandis grandis TaxID=2921223 RepID=UPI002165F9B0|nr:aspartate aminotransferase, mitochondrial-like [Anthonomus grandis grandis]